MSTREEALESLRQANATAAQEREELDKQEQMRIRDLATIYPAIANELWAHYERMKVINLDQFLSFDEWKEAYCREYWTYLKLLELVKPGLPIAEMHDELEAQLEAVHRGTMEQAANISALAEECKRDMRDLAFAYATDDQDEIDRINTKYPTHKDS
jgi:leucyl-tRNA synthetase